MLLGEKIKYLRNKSNLSQKELGVFVGYSDKVVSKWEQNKCFPPLTTVLKLARFFGTTTDKLIDEAYDLEQEKDAIKNEIVDVLESDGRKTGFTATKDEVHEKGLWHKEVSVWIINKKGEYLLTKRASNKVFSPDKWGIVAGHVYSGETEIMALERIIKRELGFDENSYSIKQLITTQQRLNGIKYRLFRTSVKEKVSKSYLNKSISTTYILYLDISESKIKYNKNEISEIGFFAADKLEELIKTEKTVFNSAYDLKLLTEGLEVDLIDIVDENDKETGLVEEKSLAHEKGLWHREALTFVYNSKGQLLAYKRPSHVRINPNVVVPYFGGHLLSGESVDEGAKREIIEELGIAPNELIFLGKTKEQNIKKFKSNRAWQYFYITKCDANLKDFNSSEYEIENLMWIDFKNIFNYMKKTEAYENHLNNKDYISILNKVKNYTK